MTGSIFVPCAALTIVLIFVIFIIRGRAEEKSHIDEILKNSWGSGGPQLFSAEKTENLGFYSDCFDEGDFEGKTSRFSGCFSVDEITAADLDLDALFDRICRTVSSPGAEVLYMWMRHPLLSSEKIAERRAISEYFRENENTRKAVQKNLVPLGILKKTSFYKAVSGLKSAKTVGRARYLFLSLLTLLGIALLFIFPAAAVCLLVPVLFADFRVHLSMRDRTAESAAGFQAVIRLLECAEKNAALNLPVFEEKKERIAKIIAELRAVKTFSFLAFSGSRTGTGFSDAVLEYVNMFFHINLIAHDALLRRIRDHIDDVLYLFEVLGETDAAIAAASYRESLPYSCDAEFADSRTGGASVLTFSDMYHPLLSEPVPNSLDTKRQILITGSNASGKSTFLKGTAIAALFAQCFGYVPASSYRAPVFRIMTSMALRDNIFGGESYFIVELRSLLRICEAASHDGPPVLAMIDEVLKGTNTVERIAASSSVLKSLTDQNIRLFAATHDNELTEILSGEYRNMHFSEQIEGGDVKFDYIIREGSAKGRNAIRLLSLTGYGADICESAEARAAHFERTGKWI